MITSAHQAQTTAGRSAARNTGLRHIGEHFRDHDWLGLEPPTASASPTKPAAVEEQRVICAQLRANLNANLAIVAAFEAAGASPLACTELRRHAQRALAIVGKDA